MVSDLKCPHCGQQDIIWDYARGDIVCTYCGTVVDKIYVNMIKKEEPFNQAKDVSQPGLKKETREFFKLLSRIKGKNLEIDTRAFEAFIKGKRPAVKMFVRSGFKSRVDVDNDVRVALRIICKYPRLASRTDRAKLAIATVAVYLARDSRVEISKIAKEYGLSRIHMRRLINVLYSEKSVIEEVRRSIRMATN
jgi:hypothetical protein